MSSDNKAIFDPTTAKNQSVKKYGSITFRPDKEDIIKALELSSGHMANAARMFKYPDGSEVPRNSFYQWVLYYDLHKYPTQVRARLASQMLDTLQEKALEEKDFRSIEMFLN